MGLGKKLQKESIVSCLGYGSATSLPHLTLGMNFPAAAMDLSPVLTALAWKMSFL